VFFVLASGNWQLATGEVSATGNWQLATGAIMYQLAILCTLCDQLATRNWQLATGGIEFHITRGVVPLGDYCGKGYNKTSPKFLTTYLKFIRR
jgi:hypothetical protein